MIRPALGRARACPSRRLLARRLATAASLLAGLAAATTLRAEPLWEAGAGVAALALPDYRGSDERRGYLLPLPYFVYRGERLRANRDGLRARLFDDDRFDLDLSATANFAIRSEGNVARAGMPKLHPYVEIGPELVFHAIGHNRTPFSLDLRGAVRAVFAIGGGRVSSEGWVANPYVRARWRNVGGYDVSTSFGALYGDRRHHEYLYGVSQDYATATRPAYDPQGGYGGLQWTLGASRRFGDLWVGGFVRLDSLRGAAFEASPLVRTRNYAAAGIAVSYIFARSSQQGLNDD